MTNYERIKAMSLEEMAAFVEAAGRNTCHKICVYRQGGENCKKMPCETGIKHWLESESEQTMRLIDADAAKAELLRMVGDIHGWGEFFDGIRSGYQSAADRLDTMPVVEERKHGHWLTKKAWHVECSECHHVLEFICDVKKYCPNCGAKMDGE